MSTEQILNARSGSKCELCASDAHLSNFAVEPSDGSANQCMLICNTCKSQVEEPKHPRRQSLALPERQHVEPRTSGAGDGLAPTQDPDASRRDVGTRSTGHDVS